MKKMSPYLFIHIGLIIRLLRQLQHGASVVFVTDEVKKLRNNLNAGGFTVAASGLYSLEAFCLKLEKKGKSKMLESGEIAELKDMMGTIEQMVYAEAETKQIYVISEKRYNLDCLLIHPERMFKDGIFDRLPPIARRDLIEGFRCIVFNMSTGGAFHILRATEAILRAYYQCKIKRRRDKVLLWGNMVQGMTSRRGKDTLLLQRLDYLKNSYRNPTSHPEAEYTLEEVQDLLGLCIDVINAMGRDLPEIKALPQDVPLFNFKIGLQKS